jgi:hypothetical protein
MSSDHAEEYQQSADLTDFKPLNNPNSKVISEEKISLLEERLIVNLIRRKVGEVVIRKEIETCLLQVEIPVRREKLIVEQLSPEYKRLAEIDLGQEPVLDESIVNPSQAPLHSLISADHDAQHLSIKRSQSSQKRIQKTFNSIESAKNLLDGIAARFDNDSETIHIEIVFKDSERQKVYQSLFDRDSSNDH